MSLKFIFKKPSGSLLALICGDLQSDVHLDDNSSLGLTLQRFQTPHMILCSSCIKRFCQIGLGRGNFFSAIPRILKSFQQQLVVLGIVRLLVISPRIVYEEFNNVVIKRTLQLQQQDLFIIELIRLNNLVNKAYLPPKGSILYLDLSCWIYLQLAKVCVWYFQRMVRYSPKNLIISLYMMNLSIYLS
ncbi:hypothetical protein FGO68_gene9753 [Halteria grandinella]|uniref:Uncharacterized protein n=1 Tax=Halteria grandinella TaxID=5974 RepID=A0A8J8NRQ5_HALGN|nr:hypothetical protein FGO68_gene9753 [Halteria grandinella]